MAQFFLALTLGEQGRISEALSLLHGLLEMTRRNSEKNTSLKIPNSIGWLYREAGDLERAMQWDSEGANVSREHRLTEAEINSVINLGYDHTLKGESSQSLSNFRDAEVLLKRDDWLAWRFNIRLQAGKTEYLLAHGALKDAQEGALGLLSVATNYRARKYIATAHKLLGEIAGKRGDLTEAIDHLNDARKVLSEYPTNILAWKVEASLGRMLLQAGRKDEAGEAFTRSAAIIDGIASNISDEALRTTFLNSTRNSDTVA
jgi:tetratricopeptide (TPR) repeat protein